MIELSWKEYVELSSKLVCAGLDALKGYSGFEMMLENRRVKLVKHREIL